MGDLAGERDHARRGRPLHREYVGADRLVGIGGAQHEQVRRGLGRYQREGCVGLDDVVVAV